MKSLCPNVDETHLFRVCLLALGLGVLILLAGCEPPARRPGAMAGLSRGGRTTTRPNPFSKLPNAGAKSDANSSLALNPNTKPTAQAEPSPDSAEKSKQDEPLSAEPLVIGGYKIDLASSLITEKGNLFLDWLPKVALEVPASGQTTASTPQIVIDPFAGISLIGISYQANSPIALLASSAVAQSQFLHKGDIFQNGENQLKVTRIQSDQIELQLLSGTKEKRILVLPSILGFKSDGASGSGQAASSSMSTSTVMPSSGSGEKSDGRYPPGMYKELKNLEKILTPLQSPGNPSGSEESEEILMNKALES